MKSRGPIIYLTIYELPYYLYPIQLVRFRVVILLQWTTVELVETAQENVEFKVPRILREPQEAAR